MQLQATLFRLADKQGRIHTYRSFVSSSDWSVLHYSPVFVSIEETTGRANLSDYKFNLDVNTTSTGLAIVGKGNGCLPSTRSQTGEFTVSAPDYEHSFFMIRCGLGNPNNTGVTLTAEDTRTGTSTTLNVTGTIRQAWHQADRRVDYKLDLAKFYDSRNTPNPQQGLMESATRSAGNTWHGVGQIRFSTVSSGEDVVVHAYRVADGDLCQGGLGCTTPGGTYPHLASQKLFIPVPPTPPYKGLVTTWTNNGSIAENNPHVHYYLPYVMIHELGHIAGLGHLPFKGGIMGNYNFVEYPRSTLTIEDRYGIRKNNESHPHP